jgi:hypothetical protein
MKKMSVKNKIATGVIAASLLGSTSFVFANSNAGSQFKAWGDAQVQAAKTAVQSALNGEVSTAQTTIGNTATTKRDAAKGRIDQAATDEKTDTKTNIESKLAEHVASLQLAFSTFMNSIGGDFDTFVAAQNQNTTSTLNDQYNTLSTNITTVLNAAKVADVQDVTEQSLLVKGKATSDLIQKINQVKSDLAIEVQSQQTTAQGEVDAHLTAEVTRINGQLDTLISGLETSAKNAISAAGQAVEDSATANFDRVINLTQTETPITVDPQKLKWVVTKKDDGSVKFTVTNSNEFDVVFKYQFVNPDGSVGGVSQTPFAESVAKPGVTTLTFDVDQFNIWGFHLDKGGVIAIQYMEENGQFKSVLDVGLY